MKGLLVVACVVGAGGKHAPPPGPAPIFQPEVLALANCSCVRRFGHANALERLYNFDYRRNAQKSGLNHQYSNLRAVLGEGLGLGRAVLLGALRLSPRHNFGRPVAANRWSDFVSFERSTFRLVEGPRRGQAVCEGSLATCVADVREAASGLPFAPSARGTRVPRRSRRSSCTRSWPPRTNDSRTTPAP